MKRLLVTLQLASVLFGDLNAQVAILEFDAYGISAEKAAVFSQHFETEIFRTGEYELIERQKIESVINEYKIQLSGLTATEKAVQLGMLVNAEYVVTGSVNSVDGIYSATAKMISVETGGIHSVANIYDQSSFNNLLMKGTISLTAQLSGLAVPSLEIAHGNLVPNSSSSSNLKSKVFAKYVIGQSLVSDKKIYSTRGFALGLDFGKGGLAYEHTEDKYNSENTGERKRESNIIAFDYGSEIFRVFFGFGPRTQYNYYFEEDQTDMIFKGAFSLIFSGRWIGLEPVLGYTLGNEKLDWYWGLNLNLYPYQW